MRENKLTEMQQLFVLHFTTAPGAIGNASEAARRAGYSDKTAAEQGRQLLDKPHVQTAIVGATRRQISATMATKAAALLEHFIEDEKVSARVRLEAAKTILDRAGYIAPKAPLEEENLDEKPLHEMSIYQLERFIAEKEALLEGDRDAVSAEIEH